MWCLSLIVADLQEVVELHVGEQIQHALVQDLLPVQNVHLHYIITLFTYSIIHLY